MKRNIVYLVCLILTAPTLAQSFYNTKANSGNGEYETGDLTVSSLDKEYLINYEGYNIFELSFVKEENGKYEYTSDRFNTLYVISNEKLSNIKDGKVEKATLDFWLSDVWIEYVKINLNRNKQVE